MTRGVRIGRPPAMTPEQVAHARDLLTQPKNTVASIARLLGVSRATIYKYVPELADSGAAVSTPRLAALATAEPITVPLAAEPTVLDTVTCPSCGSVPDGAHDRFQHRRDLAVLWLYVDDTDPSGIRVQRHCRHCQPHDQLAVVECALCGQGPILAGDLAAAMTGDALPELAARRLALAGWRTAREHPVSGRRSRRPSRRGCDGSCTPRRCWPPSCTPPGCGRVRFAATPTCPLHGSKAVRMR